MIAAFQVQQAVADLLTEKARLQAIIAQADAATVRCRLIDHILVGYEQLYPDIDLTAFTETSDINNIRADVTPADLTSAGDFPSATRQADRDPDGRCLGCRALPSRNHRPGCVHGEADVPESLPALPPAGTVAEPEAPQVTQVEEPPAVPVSVTSRRRAEPEVEPPTKGARGPKQTIDYAAIADAARQAIAFGLPLERTIGERFGADKGPTWPSNAIRRARQLGHDIPAAPQRNRFTPVAQPAADGMVPLGEEHPHDPDEAVTKAMRAQRWVARDRSGDPITAGRPVCTRCAA